MGNTFCEFFLKRMCPGTFSRLRRSLATSTLYAAACIPMEWFLLYRKAIPCKAKKRQPPIGCPFKEKVFLLWGVVKTIYIMYWGVFTVIIVPWIYTEVCTNFTKVWHRFCALCIQKKGSAGKFFPAEPFSVILTIQIFYASNNASNSSRVIFSFSRRSAAQRSSTSRCSAMIVFAFS